MNILKIENGAPKYYSVGQLKRDNPNVSFPKVLSSDLLAEYDCHKYTVALKPEYNPSTQSLRPVFEQVDGQWQRSFQIVDLPLEDAKIALKEKVTSDRWIKEQGGVEWMDLNSDTWRLNTDGNSQQKMTSVLAMMIADPTSTGYANWKMDKKVQVTHPDVDENGNEIEVVVDEWHKSFRQNTASEWNQMVGLVGSHIQKCFDAESNALTKIEAGDLNVTFQSEFDLL